MFIAYSGINGETRDDSAKVVSTILFIYLYIYCLYTCTCIVIHMYMY